MKKYIIKRILKEKSVYFALLIDCILSVSNYFVDIFPYRYYDNSPYTIWFESFTASQFPKIFLMLLPLLASIPCARYIYQNQMSGYLNQFTVSGN